MNQLGLYDTIKEFIKKIDPKSWPAFLMFLVVLVAAGTLNYISMSPVIGGFAAISIALFFGAGVLSWHIVESRTDDSEFQEQTAQTVKWVNVILDGFLLIINLFRTELRASNLINSVSIWDGIAFAIIGISAASHMIGFLLWTQNDEKRKIQRAHERDLLQVEKKRKKAEAAASGAEARLEAIKYVQDEEKRLRTQYADIPPAQLAQIIKNMKAIAFREFEGLLKDSGVEIQPPDVEQTRPQSTSTIRASDTPDFTQPSRRD